MTTEKEFIINEYLTLRLENGKTNIYVSGKHFDQCKFLMLNIPVDHIEAYDEITSIDEAAERLNWTENGQTGVTYELPPETEFFGHCSNLQAWWEHGYDTCLLHRNLAFPLLKKLVDEGDSNAQEIFQLEIIKRFESGHTHVIEFLLAEDYLKYLNIDNIQPSPQFEVFLVNLLKKESRLEHLFNFDIFESVSDEGFKSALCDADSDLLPHIIEDLYGGIYNNREFIKRERKVHRIFASVRRVATHLVAEALIKNYEKKYYIKEIIESRLFEILRKEDLEILIESEEIDFIGDFITFLGENFYRYRDWRVLFDWSYYNFPPLFYLKIRERAPHILEKEIINKLRNGDEEELEDIQYFGFLKYVSHEKLVSLLQSKNDDVIDNFFKLVEKSNYTIFNYLIDLGKLFNHSVKENIIQKIEQQDPNDVKELIKKLYWLGWVDSKDLSVHKIIEQKSFEDIKQDEGLLRTLIYNLNNHEREGLIDVSKIILINLLEEENFTIIAEFQLLNALSNMVSNPNFSDLKLTELLKNEIIKRIYEKDLNKLYSLFYSNKYIDYLTIQDLRALFSNKKLNFIELLISTLKHKSGNSKPFYQILKILVKCGDITSITFCQENFYNNLENIPKHKLTYLREINILNLPFNASEAQVDLLGKFKKEFFDLIPKHVELLKLKLELLNSTYIPLLLNYMTKNAYYEDERTYGFYSDIICKIGTLEQIKNEIYKLAEQINLSSKSHYNILLLAYSRIFSKKEFWDDFIENTDYSSIQTLEKVYDVDLNLDSYDNYYDDEQQITIWFRINNRKLTGLHFSTDYGLPLLVPDSISRLEALNYLHIYGFGLRLWPDWISNLINLEYLNLSRNKIKVIPENIKKLRSLKILNLHENQLIALPESIGDLESLEEFILDSNHENKIRSLPESIGGLKSLKKLNLRGNLLENLPKSIGNLKSLRELDLSSNRLIDLPESIVNLKNLKILDLAYNKKDLKLDSIVGLKQLEDLNLTENYFGRIPGVLNELSNLKKLNLTTNNISEIKNLDNLKKLDTLKLSNNKIREIDGLANLNGLRYLFLEMNEITEIKGLANLKKISYLNLSMNKILEIKGLNDLVDLNKLLLGLNQISEIKGLENLSNLKILYLERNNISQIKGLENLSCLYELHIKDNPIPPSIISELGGQRERRGDKVYYPKKIVEYCREKIIRDNKTSLEFVEVEGKKYYLWNSVLDLCGLKISSIKEIIGIEKLKSLKALKLNGNKLEKVQDLGILKNLKKLTLSNNEITEINGLESMQTLEHLDLSSNKISEIKGLDELKELKFLDLGGNQISEIKGLGNLGNLKNLSIGDNLIPKYIFEQLNVNYPYDNYVKYPQKYVEYCRLKNI